MAIIRVISFFIVFTTISCSVMKDDMLSLQQTEYTGNELRLDGYWWKKLESDVPRIEAYFFYKNGIVLYGRAIQVAKIIEVEEEFKSGTFAKFARRSKTGWGVFRVYGKEIEFEIWGASSGGSLKTNVRSGTILNDTTFLINSLFSNYNGKTTEVNDTFYFKEFSPKPDSTNMFIK